MSSSRPKSLEFCLIPETYTYLMFHLLLTANSFYVVSVHRSSISCHHWTDKLLCVVCVCVFVKIETITFNKQGIKFYGWIIISSMALPAFKRKKTSNNNFQKILDLYTLKVH